MSLVLILVLQFAAAAGETLVFTRAGDEVTLSCEKLLDGQRGCDGTTWTFSGSKNPKVFELINVGAFGADAGTKSGRMNITENCSLVMKKVTEQDAGRYDCDQYEPVNEIDHTLVHKSAVELSVYTVTEHKDGDQVALSCSVSAFGPCRHKVKWLFNNGETYKDERQVGTSEADCSATVSFPSLSIYPLNFWKCEVTDPKTGKVHLFPFTPPSSGDTTTTTTTRGTETSKKSTMTEINKASTDLKDAWWLYVVVAVGVVALSIAAVALVRRRRRKGQNVHGQKGAVNETNVALDQRTRFVFAGNQTQTDENRAASDHSKSNGLSFNPAVTQPAPQTRQDSADPEDGVSYATISYTKKANGKAKVWGGDHYEGDAVTYSTVRAPSSADPSSLYSTVNHPGR